MTNRSNLVPIAIFLGCGYILHMSDCLKVDAKYSQNNVVFTCNISPYTGRQIWSIDSTEVSECGFTGCSENSSNPARYSFTNDLGSGNFTFKIDPLESKEVGSIVSCFDGTNVQNHTVATGQNNTSTSNTVSNTLSSKQVNNIATTVTGTNQSATPSSLSSSSILRENSPTSSILRESSSTTSVPNEGEITVTHILPLIISAPCVVFISLIVLLSYYIVLKKDKKKKLENQNQSGRSQEEQNKTVSEESNTTVL